MKSCSHDVFYNNLIKNQTFDAGSHSSLELSAGDERDADKQKAARMSLLDFLAALAYPDPGSNRDGFPHWCLRPARLPIPPSGLYADAKVGVSCQLTKF